MTLKKHICFVYNELDEGSSRKKGIGGGTEIN